jgi:hypothetical protein
MHEVLLIMKQIARNIGTNVCGDERTVRLLVSKMSGRILNIVVLDEDTRDDSERGGATTKVMLLSSLVRRLAVFDLETPELEFFGYVEGVF